MGVCKIVILVWVIVARKKIYLSLHFTNVIYKRMVTRKIRLTRTFSFITFIEINKINKWMEYLSRLTGGYLVGCKRLLWSGLTVLYVDALSDGCRFNCSCALCLPYLYIPHFIHRLQKTLYVEKNDWLKNWLFLITENFQGILNRVCAEHMRRSHDFLSLTLAVVGLTSGRCYFLQQCQCLSVCVLCVLVVRCVNS